MSAPTAATIVERCISTMPLCVSKTSMRKASFRINQNMSMKTGTMKFVLDASGVPNNTSINHDNQTKSIVDCIDDVISRFLAKANKQIHVDGTNESSSASSTRTPMTDQAALPPALWAFSLCIRLTCESTTLLERCAISLALLDSRDNMEIF